MAGTSPQLPKPRTLLGWGMLAAATALVKEKYTDLTWGEVARAPIQGILDAYNDPKTSGVGKAWNVAVEGAKLGVGIALMAGATALATTAAPAVAATIAGSVAIAAGGLVVGGLASHFIVDPLLDRTIIAPTAPATSPKPCPVATAEYRSLANEVAATAPPEGAAAETYTRPPDICATSIPRPARHL